MGEIYKVVRFVNDWLSIYTSPRNIAFLESPKLNRQEKNEPRIVIELYIFNYRLQYTFEAQYLWFFRIRKYESTINYIINFMIQHNFRILYCNK